VKKEILRYKQLGIISLIALFIATYIIIYLIFSFLNAYMNLGVGPFIIKLIIFYVFLMYLLRVQFHSYELVLQDQQLVVKEIVSKREKLITSIPYHSIITISSVKKHKDRYYNRRKNIIKKHIKNTQMFYIEYDDSTGINLLKVQMSTDFKLLIDKNL
jgi:hypothetical protein